MANVFANGLEISGKAVDAKTIAVFPDVCFTPPENPATPPGVPIPYPSFGMANDTESGTGTVFIGGKTVNIKNKSDESKTSGTEAGCAAKKGIITSKNTGKKYFNSWSNDVKFDGEPVIRFSDLATHNHSSPGTNTPPGPEIAKLNFGTAGDPDCLVGSYKQIKDNCNARKDPNDPTKKPGTKGVAYQAHHIVPDRCYRMNSAGDRMDPEKFPSRDEGICICLPRVAHSAARPPTGEDVTVHHHLDNALTDLGEEVATKANPRGVAKVEDIRDVALAALLQLVDDPVSEACFVAAVAAVDKQTNPIKDSYARAEKSASNMSTAAKGVMASQ